MLRTATIIVRCDACDAPADTACQRCDRPSCSEHAPGGGMLCRWCENEFDRLTTGVVEGAPVDPGRHYLREWERAQVRRKFWIVALGVAIGCLPILALAVHPRFWGLGVGLLVLFVTPLVLFQLVRIGISGLLRLWRWRLRRRFVYAARRRRRR